MARTEVNATCTRTVSSICQMAKGTHSVASVVRTNNWNLFPILHDNKIERIGNRMKINVKSKLCGKFMWNMLNELTAHSWGDDEFRFYPDPLHFSLVNASVVRSYVVFSRRWKFQMSGNMIFIGWKHCSSSLFCRFNQRYAHTPVRVTVARSMDIFLRSKNKIHYAMHCLHFHLRRKQ